MKKYQIALNETQARTLMQALDMYFRVGMGQLREVTEHLIPKKPTTSEWCDIRDQVEPVMARAKALAMPELHPNAYYGIYAPEIDESNRVASDLHKVIRHHLAWEREPKGGMTVDFDPPELRKVSTEPLAEMTAVGEEPTCGECGSALTEVRPGRHQCDACDLQELEADLRLHKEDRLRLRAENLRLTRERDEARETLAWQASCTKALMESQERLAAELKESQAEAATAYQRGAEAMREAAASCVGSDTALLQTYRSVLEGRIRDLPVPEDTCVD
jgi:hypothetical protein